MSKYKILYDEDNPRTIDDICTHLIDIANELAEANRLFILKYGVHDYNLETPQHEVDRLEKAWSDQA